MKWSMTAPIALAKQTKQNRVLPRLNTNIGRSFVWKVLDLKTVEEMGVAVQETKLLSYPKLSEFPSVNRAAVGKVEMIWEEDNKEW